MKVNKDYLDELALTYHLNKDNHSDMFIEDMMQEYLCLWLKEQLLVPGPILELGYGNGIITDFLATMGYPITIVEGSKKLCETVASKYQKRCNIVHDLFDAGHRCTSGSQQARLRRPLDQLPSPLLRQQSISRSCT